MMAKHWPDWRERMRDHEQQAAIRQMLAQAWDEGVTAFAKARAYESPDRVREGNPYRVIRPARPSAGDPT